MLMFHPRSFFHSLAQIRLSCRVVGLEGPFQQRDQCKWSPVIYTNVITFSSTHEASCPYDPDAEDLLGQCPRS